MPASSFYPDTSLLIALFVDEEASDRVATWFTAQAEEFIVSDWTLVEFTSALGLKVRTHQITARQADDAQTSFEETLLPRLKILPMPRSAFARAQLLMRRYALGLRAGDALHVAMCVSLGLDAQAPTLATADRVLYAAAKALKVNARRVS